MIGEFKISFGCKQYFFDISGRAEEGSIPGDIGQVQAGFCGDEELHTLHALRIGLCAKVDKGQITLKQATVIFESARETIIQKRGEDLKQEQDKRKLQSKAKRVPFVWKIAKSFMGDIC